MTVEREPAADIQPETLRELARMMALIRRFEEKIIEVYDAQDMKTPVHLCLGQEAIAAGVCHHLRRDDYVFTNHRSHGHCLAKGIDPKHLYAELYGRVDGCCHGRGGSMHPADPDCGILGTSAIVGGGIPLAVGTALASVMKDNGRVSVTFFGDGAVDEGTFHESLNFASLKALPVVFVCENNFWSVASPQSARHAQVNIAKHADAYGMPGLQIDGNDVTVVYRAADQAIQRARAGQGPTLVEARTYRWKGHVGPDTDWQRGARPKEELDEWLDKCPVRRFAELLISGGIMTEDEHRAMVDEVGRRVDAAIAFAKASPLPNPADVRQNVYCSGT